MLMQVVVHARRFTAKTQGSDQSVAARDMITRGSEVGLETCLDVWLLPWLLEWEPLHLGYVI